MDTLLQQATHELFSKLELFPGSLEEFNSFKDGTYVIMDTGKQEKFVYFNPEWLKEGIIAKLTRTYNIKNFLKDLTDLIESGCEALIRYKEDGINGLNYGIPVKRK